MESPTVARALVDISAIFDELLGSLSTLQKLGNIEIQRPDSNNILTDALAALIEYYSIDYASIYRFREDSYQLAAEMTWQQWSRQSYQRPPLRSSRIPRSRLPQLHQELERNEPPLLCNNCRQRPESAEFNLLHPEAPIGSFLAFPLALSPSQRGVLCLSHAEAGHFNEWHVRLLPLFSTFLGRMFQTSVILHDQEKLIRERTDELEKVLAESRRLEQHYKKLSLVDELTGLFNRRYFFAEAMTTVSRALRYGNSFSVALIDLDNFKRINDTYGHSAGDQVLKDVAERLRTTLRKADIIARVGGEEFACALPDTTETGGKELAERLRLCIEEKPFTYREEKIQVTVSIGVASISSDRYSGRISASFPEQLLDQMYFAADSFMYEAKESGGNRVINGCCL